MNLLYFCHTATALRYWWNLRELWQFMNLMSKWLSQWRTKYLSFFLHQSSENLIKLLNFLIILFTLHQHWLKLLLLQYHLLQTLKTLFLNQFSHKLLEIRRFYCFQGRAKFWCISNWGVKIQLQVWISILCHQLSMIILLLQSKMLNFLF